MDENNQYGMAMTKPLPYGCIKKKRIALLPLLNLIKLQMKFLPRTLWGIFLLLTSNLMTLILKHHYLMNSMPPYLKKMEPYERSTLQLLSIMVRNEEKEKN